MNYRLPQAYFPLRLVSVLFLLCSSGMVIASSEAESLFNAGLELYENGNYEAAIKKLEDATRLKPKKAEYHHILALSYGHEAENANWIRAMGLAKKTLTHLEIASNLDNYNVEILDDLMDYYREAPAFLGGDIKKADEIEVLIKKLNQSYDQISMNPVSTF